MRGAARPMRRRALIGSLAATAVAWPRALHAQQRTVRVIGFLGAASADSYPSRTAALRQGLSDSGYAEGQNLSIEYRYAEGHFDRLPRLAADLVGRKVEVIVAATLAAAKAAKNATSTIPVAFVTGGDPVADGLVASMAWPGGNLTGVTVIIWELMPKLLEVIAELVPQARAIAVLVDPQNPLTEHIVRNVREAARAKGLALPVISATSEGEIDTAFANAVQLQAGALIIGPEPVFLDRREQLLRLAARHALPTIYFSREFVAAGGLISYGADIVAAYHLAGIYAGKILNGASPADLPVEQPTRYSLAINLKTAKALGLTVPQSMLQRADEVIE